jgi:Cell wall-associated hydrolases (invasion-associated proteins)
LSKALHKRKIRRDYAKAVRNGTAKGVKNTAATAKKTAQKATETAQKTGRFIARHWKGIAIVLAAILLIVFLFAGISSCGSMLQGGLTGIVGTSYTAEDDDINVVEGDYSALETGLRQQIGNIERDYPGYDEYRYFVDEIGHDPFELASYLTAKYNSYTREQVQAELQSLFGQQYTLTIQEVVEVRYRTETRTGTTTYTDPETGESYSEDYEYEVEVPYDYYILNVTLNNKSLGSVIPANLTPEQLEMYAVYMETQGNKPYLFEGNVYVNRGEYTDYDIPPEALNDATFAAMIAEAEKYLGYPYVWGGSSPSTSFDCSGFVCWVINQSGVGSVGRTTANGLFNHCAIIPYSEAKPGDLIFFQGTYNTAGASHVGIVRPDRAKVEAENRKGERN